jgi:hypothetical protein
MARFWLPLLLLLPLWATEPEKTVTFGRGFQNTTMPAFDRGYLLFDTPLSGNLEIWGPDGQQRFFTTVENPPGASVYSLAVDSDGSVAAGLMFDGPQGVVGGIAYFDRSGKQTRLVETGKYMPVHVCFDGNHSLWTFGWQRNPLVDRQDRHDYMMFRKYSHDGSETGRFGKRSILPGEGLAPGGTSLGSWRIRAADDRVGALAYSGKTSGNLSWIELGLDGHLIGQWPLGEHSYGGYAFTGDARLCRQVNGDTPKIECFDRSAAAWKSAGDAPIRGVLLGAQKDELVFSQDEGMIQLWWVRVP